MWKLMVLVVVLGDPEWQPARGLTISRLEFTTEYQCTTYKAILESRNKREGINKKYKCIQED